MMKGAVVGLLLLAPVAAVQKQPSQIQPARIGLLNPDQLMLTCDEGKRDFGDLQKYVDQKNNEGAALTKEAAALKQKLEVQGGKLTDEARLELQDQIEAKDSEMQKFQQETQATIEKRRARIADRMLRKARPVIETLAREKGLSCVLYMNQMVAWADPSTVVTDDIVKAYNTAYPVVPPQKK